MGKVTAKNETESLKRVRQNIAAMLQQMRKEGWELPQTWLDWVKEVNGAQLEGKVNANRVAVFTTMSRLHQRMTRSVIEQLVEAIIVTYTGFYEMRSSELEDLRTRLEEAEKRHEQDLAAKDRALQEYRARYENRNKLWVRTYEELSATRASVLPMLKLFHSRGRTLSEVIEFLEAETK